MKHKKAFILVVICAIFVFAGYVRMHYFPYNITTKAYSPQLSEKGIVEDVIYTPSNHGSGVSPGLTTDGKLTMSITGVSIPEKYAIVFKCHDHGVKFIIEDDQAKAKEMWNRLSRDQEVTIFYRQVFEVTTETNRGVKKEIERKLIDLDFVDAR